MFAIINVSQFTLIAQMFGKQIIHTLSVQTASCRFTDLHVCVLGVNAAHFLKLRRLASVGAALLFVMYGARRDRGSEFWEKKGCAN